MFGMLASGNIACGTFQWGRGWPMTDTAPVTSLPPSSVILHMPCKYLKVLEMFTSINNLIEYIFLTFENKKQTFRH